MQTVRVLRLNFTMSKDQAKNLIMVSLSVTSYSDNYARLPCSSLLRAGEFMRKTGRDRIKKELRFANVHYESGSAFYFKSQSPAPCSSILHAQMRN